jgi:hypothetical protein
MSTCTTPNKNAVASLEDGDHQTQDTAHEKPASSAIMSFEDCRALVKAELGLNAIVFKAFSTLQ